MYGLVLGLWAAAIAPDCARADGGHHDDGRGRDERDGGHDKPHHPPEPPSTANDPPNARVVIEDPSPPDEPAAVRTFAPPILGTPAPLAGPVTFAPAKDSRGPATIIPPSVSRDTLPIADPTVARSPVEPPVERERMASTPPPLVSWTTRPGAHPLQLGPLLTAALALAGVLGTLALWTVPALRPALVVAAAVGAGLAVRCIR